MTVPVTIERSYAKYDLKLAMIKNLFLGQRRGVPAKDADLIMREVHYYGPAAGKDPKTGQSFEVKDGYHLRMIVPSSLNDKAETILLAILKLMAIQGAPIDPSQGMAAQGDLKDQPQGSVPTTRHQILRTARLGDGREDYLALSRYLRLLGSIVIFYENAATGESGNSLFLEFLEKGDDISIKVNWQLAGGIFGSYLHAEIDLDERYALQHAAAKGLHRWLSAHIWAGKTLFVTYKTLAAYAYGDEVASGSTFRQRLTRVRWEILPALDALPAWSVEKGEDGANITHHRIARPELQ